MTVFRLLSLSAHSALELLAGLAVMAAPFVLGLTGAGLVVPFALGVLLVGLALGAGDSLPVSAHFAFDQMVVAGGLVAALALSLAGDRVASVVLLVVAAAQLALTLTTRYSRPASAPRP